MNLRQASRSHRLLSVSGFDRDLMQWVPAIALGSLRSNDFFVTNTEYSISKRTLACSDLDRLDAKYHMVRVGEETFLTVSELINSDQDGAYQYVYQIRAAEHTAIVYRHVATTMASGMPGKAVLTHQYDCPVDIAGVGRESSSEIDLVRYPRVNIYFPGDVDVTVDDEVDILGQSYDIQVVQPFSRLQIASALRRGDSDTA